MSTDPGHGFHALADPLVAAIARSRPVYAALFADGRRTLRAFVESFAHVALPAIQDRADYIASMTTAARAAQGDAVAQRLHARLQRSPVVFTANHLSLETLPLTVQSMIVASFGEAPDSVLPVEASGLIPADNASYPIGMTLARRHEGRPLRVPILGLSKKQRRQTAMRLRAITADDLAQAAGAARTLLDGARVGVQEHAAMQRVFDEVLRVPGMLAAPDFAQQIAQATPALWDRWFDAEARRAVPALAYCGIESIRTPLLIADLLQPQALLHRVFFSPVLRAAVLQALNGVPCCWTDGGRAGGSALLWEVTAEQRLAPLAIDDDALVGTDGVRIPLTPDAIVQGLDTGRLVPTSGLALMVGLVRGLVQVGGFNQVDYLLAIQSGLAAALAATGCREWAGQLALLPPPMLTAGLSGFLAGYRDGSVAPAGGIELIAHGGLRLAELERARSLSLTAAMAPELPGIARMVLGGQAAEIVAGCDGDAWARALAARLPVLPME